MRNLYDIKKGLEYLLDRYAYAETDEEASEILLEIMDTGADLREKSDDLARVVKNLAAMQQMYKTEANRFSKLASSAERGQERIKKSLLEALILAQIDKQETSIGTWSVRLNPAAVEVVDLELIPEEYRRPQPIVPDKPAIKAAIEAKKEVPGCTLTRSQSLQFR